MKKVYITTQLLIYYFTPNYKIGFYTSKFSKTGQITPQTTPQTVWTVVLLQQWWFLSYFLIFPKSLKIIVNHKNS